MWHNVSRQACRPKTVGGSQNSWRLNSRGACNPAFQTLDGVSLRHRHKVMACNILGNTRMFCAAQALELEYYEAMMGVFERAGAPAGAASFAAAAVHQVTTNTVPSVCACMQLVCSFAARSKSKCTSKWPPSGLAM